MPEAEFQIEEWPDDHPYFSVLMEFAARVDQKHWLTFSADWHRSSHVLVARQHQTLKGFLRFVIQSIGPDAECPPVQYKGVDLLEAKILAFAVDEPYQRQGIGRQLQQELIRQARERDCYQIRSHSSGDHEANHQLKLSMGYGVHPIVRGDDRRGMYFLLPLKQLE